MSREHWACATFRLEIRKGETFCIVGENGSGKSTLLKLMVGILQPTRGRCHSRARDHAAGTGLGLQPGVHRPRQRVPERRDPRPVQAGDRRPARRDSGVRRDRLYIDQPVKTYSSGMVVRLAFAVAVHLDPDILIVDEALAVGDIYFRQRCMRKIHELRSRGVTIVYVTHDVADVKAIGDRALWLHQGRVMELGDTRDVAVKYLAALVRKDSSTSTARRSPRSGERPTGPRK